MEPVGLCETQRIPFPDTWRAANGRAAGLACPAIQLSKNSSCRASREDVPRMLPSINLGTGGIKGVLPVLEMSVVSEI